MSCLSNLKTGYYYDVIVKHDILDECPLIPQTFGNVKNDCKKCTLAQADDMLDNLSVEDMLKQRILWWDVVVDSLFRASHALAVFGTFFRCHVQRSPNDRSQYYCG